MEWYNKVMATFSKRFLSGSTNGRQILVAATASPGTLIHTATTGTTSIDEVWIYAVNSSINAVKLTVQFGGTTVNSDDIELSILPESGLTLVVPGLPLQNSLEVRAFASVTNVINISGYVNRIS
jgi:uncharacterized membrane protein YjjP (DUF1212 family)